MKHLSLLVCALLGACGADDSSTGRSADPVAGTAAGLGGTGATGGGSPGATTGGNTAGGSPGAAGVGGTGGGTGGVTNGGQQTGPCKVQTLQSGRVPPDILIVLDRSGSMKRNQTNRWDPSVAGIKTITSRLEDRVRFGLMTFPGLGMSMQPDLNACLMLTDFNAIAQCVANAGMTLVNSECAPGQLVVPIQAKSAMMIAGALTGITPDGATPTAAALEAAHKQLQSVQAGPDMVVGAKYVLLVTDGAPNCSGNGNNANQDPAAVQASIKAVQDMTKDGIKTYVLGYDTQMDPALRGALDQMAQAGGTGDSMHRAIGDEASLVKAFEQITAGLIACEFALSQTVADASYVKVLLDGKQLNVNDANGWVLGAERSRVVLQGSACETVKQDGHTISVSIECDRVVLQ